MISLCTIVGTGRDGEADFRPAGTTAGTVPPWLDLRPDVTVADGFGIVDLPPMADSRLHPLALDPAERLAVTSHQALGSRLGLTLGRRDTVADMLRELLEDHATGSGRWRRLRPKVSGRVEIHLGSRCVYERQDAPRKHTQTWTETFPNVGTGAVQDQTWVSESGTWNVVSGSPNVVRGNVAGTLARYRSPALDSDDLEIACTFDLASAAENNVVHLAARRSDVADTDYRMNTTRNSGGHSRILRRRVTGVNTTLASDTTDPGASGTILCSADGSSVRGVCGSFDQSVTDTNITGNAQCGLLVSAASDATRSQLRGDMTLEDIVAATFGFNVFDGGLFDGRVCA